MNVTLPSRKLFKYFLATDWCEESIFGTLVAVKLINQISPVLFFISIRLEVNSTKFIWDYRDGKGKKWIDVKLCEEFHVKCLDFSSWIINWPFGDKGNPSLFPGSKPNQTPKHSDSCEIFCLLPPESWVFVLYPDNNINTHPVQCQDGDIVPSIIMRDWVKSAVKASDKRWNTVGDDMICALT